MYFRILIIFMFISNDIKYNYGFNLSPKPNLVFKEPNLKTYLPKYRSSYFGFTIVLRENSFIVGAPRAQSTLELQRKVNETGAIYKCSLYSQQCAPYVFDSLGNIFAENSEYTYDSEKKDYQWLGAAMDGGPKETDRLVVCAPRLIANLQNDYLMHGVCYWTPDTIAEKSLKIKKISPLRLKADQIREIDNVKYFYYMFGEQGISVHITENNEEIIIGAPGIHTWKGSVILYSAKIKEDVGGLSRRESSNKLNNFWQSFNNRLHKRETIEYVSEIPNPDVWDQPNDSYFGYSVTSGFFDLPFNMKKLLYIASAPQANKQSGEVYLFDIIKTSQGYHSIKKYYTFHGNQFGEYFGYAVLAEDVNNDGLTDVIVSAPLHSITKYYEKGAIYVFMNKGKMNFENAKIITAKTDVPGRFGTTITKLGDINHDGYNDIAVGAPFEGNGAVYIFLGSNEGLKDKSSQTLKYPRTGSTDKFLPAMFGHGLSKGVDIDHNGFNDFAIGAPNSEIVYLYKSYPVISIDASVKALNREIKIDQTKFQLSMCYRIESTTLKIHEQEIIIKLKADAIQKRVLFTNTKSNEMILVVTAKETQECRLIDAIVKFNVATIFKPIEIEMQYKLKNEILRNVNQSTEIEDFCETCAVVDPSASSSSVEKISFSTGCKDECVADMKIKSSGLSPSFIIGNSRTITVRYEIINTGENAYLPQINVTSSNNMPFARIPPHCEQNDFTMICNLYNKHPMLAGDKDFITIVFDASNIEAGIENSNIVIQAEVSSTGKELNPDDNTVLDIIELKEMSNVEITGYSNPSTVSLVDNSGIIEIINMYEIRNNGPSKIKEMNVSVFIPILYLLPNSNIRVPIVDFNTVKVNAIYNEKELRNDFYQNNVILLKNSVESSSTPISIIENLYKIETEFDISLLNNNLWSEKNQENLKTMHTDNGHLDLQMMTRKKRSTKNDNSNYMTNKEKISKNLDLDFMSSLPINKSVLFDCDRSSPESTYCIKAMTNVYDFEVNSNNILNVTIKFNVDLTEINKILLEPLEFFIITTDLQLANVRSDSLTIIKTIAHNIISKHQIYSTPIWVYVISILGGILVLAIISYLLHKCGFFRREKKEELQKLHRESKIQQTEDTEDEG